MNTTIHNALARNVQRHEKQSAPIRTIIRHVNYETRHIQVSRQGAYIRHVKVQQGIDLGTKQAPIVFAGDVAMVQRDAVTKKWLCVEIRSKVHCPSNSVPSGVVEVNTDADTSNSAITQKYALTIQPSTLFNPFFESLGQLTLPSQQFGGGDKVGGGYAGAFSGSFAQNIGVPDATVWGHYFVYLSSGTATWTMELNGSTIASGSGTTTASFNVSAPSNSRFTFSFNGTGSDLWFGVGT